MLKLLRKKKTMKRILWGLAILIVPAFVLWGAGSGSRSVGKGPSHVGKIYGKKISFEKFAKSYEACYHQLVLSSGGDPEILKRMLDSTNTNLLAWNRLVMLSEATRQKIKVTDAEVVNTIASAPMFKRGGAFDKELYNYILRNILRIPPRKFEEETKETLVLAKLKDKVLQDIFLNEDAVLEEYKKENERIKISFILIDNEGFIDDVELGEEELKNYYEKSKNRFRKDEEVNIRYFYIETEGAELLYKLTDEIQNKKSFEEIAKENNLKIKETGFFGMNEEIPTIGWSYELIRIAFSLEEGMTSFPISTPKGYYVINVKKKRTGHIPSFEEAQASLKKELLKIKSFELAKESASEVYKNMLEEPGKKASFKQSNAFSRKEYIEGIGQAVLLKNVAFTLPEGQINPPVACEKGFVIFKVDEKIPADEEKFKEEKENLKQRLRTQKETEALNSWFEKVSQNAELYLNLDLLPR